MEQVRNKYTSLCNESSDINEHLPTIYKYATECESVLELGVRGCVSSWAFAFGLLNNERTTRKLTLNDIYECNIEELLTTTKGLNINIDYKWIDDLKLEIAMSNFFLFFSMI